MDNFGFRYYDAELGRFTSRDPSGYPDGPNNYLYCHNNPINFVDPLGLVKRSEYEEYIKFLEKRREFDVGRLKKDKNLEYNQKALRKRFDKKIDKIKGYISERDEQRDEYNSEARKVFGSSLIDKDWDDEKVVNWNYDDGIVHEDIPLRHKAARFVTEAIALEFTTAGIGKFKYIKDIPKLIKFLKFKKNFSAAKINAIRTELKVLRAQGYSKKESVSLIREFSKGINPGGNFAFHFTTQKGAQGILKDGAINASKNGYGGAGIYAGTTPTPSFLLKHASPFGWGLGRTPYRIPINITGMNTAKSIYLRKATIVKESKVVFSEVMK